MKRRVSIKSISKGDEALAKVEIQDQKPLPPPYDKMDTEPEFKPLTDAARKKYVVVDDTIALNIPIPETPEQEAELVDKFLSGMRKLFTPENNWTFLQQLQLTVEHCASCHTCSDSCHIYEESGRNPIYRPTYRAEVFRRIYRKYIQGKSKWHHGDIDLNWKTVTRLIELSYRCNICRRCAQTCPLGCDNAVIAREIRKLASQEMNISPPELHENGSVLQMQVGSSTGMNELVVKDNVDFIDEDTTDLTGIEVKTPFDKQGADVMMLHNAGEIMAWPENVGSFSLILQQAGVDFTMSSDAQLAGYDGINYGVFYDDVQFARTALLHAQAAKKLGVRRIVIGECGHANKALTVIADRVLTGDLNIPRENGLVLVNEIIQAGKLKLDPSRNDFPVTLHDPCNMVRLMGIVQPQREILEAILPPGRFREMTPHGVNNYCCGGGSGFAIMSGHNFADWRHHVAGRKKWRQILGAFQDEPMDKEHPKYVCAPCSNCKGQIRDILAYHGGTANHGIYYGGLVELVVNAMVDVKPGYIDFEEMM